MTGGLITSLATSTLKKSLKSLLMDLTLWADWATSRIAGLFSASGIGDQFTIEANFGGSGDNSNALRLADLQSLGVLDGGAMGIGESYSQLVASVGGTTHQIQAGLSAQNVVLANAENAVLSKSAVNLDEEAANLIRFQQAYQAAAQIVNITKILFDSLLAATSR